MSDVEFSRVIALDELGGETTGLSFEASPEERAALARRFGIVAVNSLSGRAEISRRKGSRRLRANVTFTADVIQSCVVTLDPVSARVEDSLNQEFVLVDRDAAQTGERDQVTEVSMEDAPEPIYGGDFDLGEWVAQAVALTLDPYPRKPGVEFEGFSTEPNEEKGAFAALAKLRQGKQAGSGG